ncbi:MAG: amidohydrolase, partial [Actinomycetota bacterium]
MSDGVPPGHVDVHAHVVLEDTLGAAGSLGPFLEETGDGRPQYRIGDYCLEGVDYRGTAFMDAEVRLARMDEAGIGHQALSPNPLTWFHHAAPAIARDWCRAHNDALAAHIAP